jgi:hypothetical protein
MLDGPRSEYARRLDARQRELTLWEGRQRRLAHVRLGVFAAGVGWLWLALSWDALPDWTIALPVLGFVWGVVRHDGATRAAQRAARAVDYYRRGLARLAYDLHDAPKTGDDFRDAAHLYSDHLDLFGPGSLYARLCGAQTRAGEDTLARWLLSPSTGEEIRARHAAVDELRSRLDLREDLSVLGPEVAAGLHPDALADWGERPRLLAGRASRWIALGLALSMLAAAIAALTTGLGILPLVAVATAELAFALPLRRRVQQALADSRGPVRDLALLAELLGRIEEERFGSTRLAELRASLDTEGLAPSRTISRLQFLVRLLEARQNQLFAPLAPLLLWSTQIAFAVEAWRAECGPRLRGWIETVGEIEALVDLSRYAWEEPDDPFPEIVDGGPRFDAEQIGHPLIPRERCAFNDLRLDAELSLLVVSGSNMSGKSTLLRSLGSNVLLALAGAPVRARRLTLSPLALGPSLRIRDSLEDGASRFYAEITCLRGIVDLTDGPIPVLFLLDEILAGTNSHDRGIGAAAVVRGLIERGAIGLVTTHDLALTKIADALAPRARNVHFQDELVEGEMHFDYRIRDGIVTRSNALELMRAVGLEV